MNKFRYESSALEVAQLINGTNAEVKANYYVSCLSSKIEELDTAEKEKVMEELKQVLEGNIHFNEKLSNRKCALHTVIRFFEVSKVNIEKLEREKRVKESIQDPSINQTERALFEEIRKKDELKEWIEILIKKGADPSLEDNYENNCYELANDSEIFEILIKGRDMYEEKIKESGRSNHPSIIFLSLQKGLTAFEVVFKKLDKEYRNKNLDIKRLRDLAYDPVSEIIKTYNVKMLEKLMDIGQKIVDSNGRNILTEAIVEKKQIIFDYLIEKVTLKNELSEEYSVRLNGNWVKRVAETEARIIRTSINDSHYFEGVNRKLSELSINLRINKSSLI